MSAFSEEIRQEIKKSGKTLLYLSGASGLSLDHISKMRMGKRLPGDEKKVRALIAALECPGRTGRHLLSLYKIEKLGKAEWDCIVELKKLLGFRWSPGWKAAASSPVLPERELREISVLNSRSEIGAFLMRIMQSEWQCPKGRRRSALLMLTGELPPEIVGVLAVCPKQQEWSCEHFFPLKRNVDTEAALSNLRCVNRLLPLLQKKEQYVPSYDYGEKDIAPEMNWIVGERWALGLDGAMESGFVIWEREQVAYLRRHIGERCRNGRKLWKPVPDSEDEGQQSRSWFTGGEGAFVLSDFPYRLLWEDGEEAPCSFFTLEGLDRFVRTGDMPEPVKRERGWIPPEERRRLAERYLSGLETGKAFCAVIDGTALSLVPGICWYARDNGAGGAVCGCLAENTGEQRILGEGGISERVCRLFRLMESGGIRALERGMYP